MSQSHRFSRTSTYQSRTITVTGKIGHASVGEGVSGDNVTLKLTFSKILGKGTFGCIEQATVNDSKQTVAIKRVFQDPRYKNRELNILMSLDNHPNLVELHYYYYTCSQTPSTSTSKQGGSGGGNSNSASSGSTGEIYLHLVMECFPESLADLILRHCRRQQRLAAAAIRLYTYQMLRALGYIHLRQICHRDIKSSNLLVNEATGQVKLCDFGSAKEMVAGQANVAYISSRYYRAPELIFGAEQYDCAIDVWSAGCVLAEMILRKCLFMGGDSVDQLAEIIKVLGTPSLTDIQAMNPRYSSYSFPNVSRCPLRLYLPMETPSDLIALLTQMLVYRPSQRVKPLLALTRLAFDELHKIAEGKSTSLPQSSLPPHLFLFTSAELIAEPELKLISRGDYSAARLPASSSSSASTSSMKMSNADSDSAVEATTNKLAATDLTMNVNPEPASVAVASS